MSASNAIIGIPHGIYKRLKGKRVQKYSTRGTIFSFIYGWQLAFLYAVIEESFSLFPKVLALLIALSMSLNLSLLKQTFPPHLALLISKP